jgi:hypothetical protein
MGRPGPQIFISQRETELFSDCYKFGLSVIGSESHVRRRGLFGIVDQEEKPQAELAPRIINKLCPY